MQLKDAHHIISGNQRVVRPRLADARFFYEQDRKQPLEARLPRLAQVVFHNKLGSMLARVERLEALAGRIATLLGADAAAAARAARLAKADLGSEMVGEFPELQGIMGRYYALNDGETETVAQAIQTHYYPRFAGDALPQGAVAVSVAKVAATRVGLDLTSRMFDVAGARATHAGLRLDRYWRNLRTHTLHDPIDYKIRELGTWALMERYPTPTFYS